MKYQVLLIFGVIIWLYACENQKESFSYPDSKKTDTVDNYFGIDVPDPYRWMENDTSDEVANWVTAQNEFTFKYLDSIPFREKIRERLTEIWNYPKQGAPFKEGGRYFFYKNDGLQNQSVLYVKDDLNTKERIFLDPNKLSKDGTVSLSGLEFSKDGKYCAYSISRGGSDWKEIFVIETSSGKLLSDHLKWVKFSGISWYEDGFYYSGFDQPEKGKELSVKNEYHKLFYHRLGQSQGSDKLVMDNKEIPSRMFYADVTNGEKYLVVYEENQGDKGHSLHVLDHENQDNGFITIIDDFENNYAVIGSIDTYLFIKTNDGAAKYRLVKCDVSSPEKANWVDIIPESTNVLSSVKFVADKFAVNYMKDAHSVLQLFSYEGENLKEIVLPTLGRVDGVSGKKGDSIGFYSFNSFTYPPVIYKYNFITNEQTEYYKSKIDFDPELYHTEQVFYKSTDGTEIPMFIVHKKGIELDGTNPTLLYGYGGFNVSLLPSFRTSRLIWLENGGVYAIANLRGGGEYGEEWHLAGTKLNKQNVFDDFIAGAEYLIEKGYTCSEKLAIQGGSNGGLLVGAVVNQRPELFKVALPAVGVMDMLRFQNFTIGAGWVSDYGSSDIEEEFHYIYKYSPLHNVRSDVKYPAVLVTTADHDDRVVPAHSFKYIATLQEKYKGENPVMIRIDVMAGHGAGKPTSKIIDEVTDLNSFTFYNMGVNIEY